MDQLIMDRSESEVSASTINLNGLNVWKSNPPCDVKLYFVSATVDSFLLYVYENWTLSLTLQRFLDRCYSRKLHELLNINQSEPVSSQLKK